MKRLIYKMMVDYIGGRLRVELDKIVKMNQMTKKGAKKVADNLSEMLGVPVEMKVTKVELVDVRDIPETIGDEEFVGVYLTFEGLFSGVLVVLFPVDSAKKIATLLLHGIEEDTGGELTEMDYSAMREVGNIMVSSFIDGWANLFKTDINISIPQSIRDMGAAIIDPVVVHAATKYENAFVFNSLIMADREDIRCELFVIPDFDELMKVIENL